MTIGGTDRRFVTPQMQAGVQHLYTVKVEVVRNGQTVSKTAQATVTAGQEVAVAVAFDAQSQQELVASAALRRGALITGPRPSVVVSRADYVGCAIGEGGWIRLPRGYWRCLKVDRGHRNWRSRHDRSRG